MGEEDVVSLQDVVILLPTLAAELEGEEEPCLISAGLTRQAQGTPLRRLQGGEERPSLADELVQFEGEGTALILAHQ